MNARSLLLVSALALIACHRTAEQIGLDADCDEIGYPRECKIKSVSVVPERLAWLWFPPLFMDDVFIDCQMPDGLRKVINVSRFSTGLFNQEIKFFPWDHWEADWKCSWHETPGGHWLPGTHADRADAEVDKTPLWDAQGKRVDDRDPFAPPCVRCHDPSQRVDQHPEYHATKKPSKAQPYHWETYP